MSINAATVPLGKGYNVNEATTPTWRRSTRCDSGTCVEVAFVADHVAMRDARGADGPLLRFSRGSWATFLAGMRNGEFDS
jgi:hypothetical protein